MKKSIGSIFLALVLLTVSSGCAVVSTSVPTTPQVPPTATVTPAPTSTATPRPTSTATPEPTGKLDTGMGGSLSIQGVVKDSFGDAAPYVPIHLTVFEETVFWDKTGSGYHRLGEWNLHANKTGSYSFNGLPKVEKGHYEVWFSEDRHEYEESGYYIMEDGGVPLLFIGKGNSSTHFKYSQDNGYYTYTFDVTVHRITNSALCAAIQYKDSDGVIKNYFSKSLGPDHRIELNRGTSHPDGHEYTISDGFTSDGSQACLQDLAGGTYYFIFQYIQSDGIGVTCVSPSFEIPPGQTKQFEYAIQDCSP
jgi:hypothetical protein